MDRFTMVFGDASYITKGVIRAKRLKRGDGWKQAYVAIISGLDDTHGLNRTFINMKGEVSESGKPLMTWNLPENFTGMLELGWWSQDVAQSEASTLYLMCFATKGYIEVTEAQCYREMVMNANKKAGI